VGFAGEMVSVAYNNKIIFAEMGTKKLIKSNQKKNYLKTKRYSKEFKEKELKLSKLNPEIL
jgi:hypothetical protein